MVKKMVKYSKFILCIALILSLVAPSYAALSASDGSAFVTKAEFDSALADFNARLTTFEAGINSKIDSQVTSYLDRNGIWNGKNQSSSLRIPLCVFQEDWGYEALASGRALYHKGEFTTSAASYVPVKVESSPNSNDRFYWFKKSYDYKDFEFVNEITKSGMFVADLVERMDASFENKWDTSKPYIWSWEANGDVKWWSQVYCELPSNQQNADSLMNVMPTPGNSAGYGPFMVIAPPDSATAAGPRAISGYYGLTAAWIVQIVNQDDKVLWNNISYSFNTTDMTSDDGSAYAYGFTWSEMPHLYNLSFFVSKNDRLRLRLGWQGVGRFMDEKVMGLYYKNHNSSAGKWSGGPCTNQILWYYGTREEYVY